MDCEYTKLMRISDIKYLEGILCCGCGDITVAHTHDLCELFAYQFDVCRFVALAAVRHRCEVWSICLKDDIRQADLW